MFDLSGKHALVTGGGRGIGRAIAIALAHCGAEAAINFRANAAAAEETLLEIQNAEGRAWTIQADVSLAMDVRRMFDKVRDRLGSRLDILVNNAGSTDRSMLLDLSEEAWDHAMTTNAKSVFLCTQAALPLLPDQSGRIVNITSISARSGGGADSLHYAAAKAAVSNFTRGCAKILAPRGITVNGVAPGVIYTDMHKFGTSKSDLENLLAKVPLMRLGEADDSVHEIQAKRNFAHYSVSKGGLLALSKCMALELAADGIQVNHLTVGAVETDMTPASRCQSLLSAIPAGRIGQPTEVAALVCFLASTEADYITGASIAIDGGLTLGFCASRPDL